MSLRENISGLQEPFAILFFFWGFCGCLFGLNALQGWSIFNGLLCMFSAYIILTIREEDRIL